MSETQEVRPTIFQLATEAATYIKSCIPEELSAPKVGIICGSGLGGLVKTLEAAPQDSIPYSKIPGFPGSSVIGHASQLVLGFLGEKKTPVVVMVGRAHFYEGHSIEKITFPVRVMKLLGVESIIVTNAAGGLNPLYKVGDIMILNDHINFPGLAGNHPLRGPNEEGFGTRFPALSDAYDLEFRRVAHFAYRKLPAVNKTRKLHEGVYAFVSGPTFETRAECRMLQHMGADVVGMSTVPEICVARHAGLRVLAMSLVTNAAVLQAGPTGDSISVEGTDTGDLNKVIEAGKANHQEVLETGVKAAADMQALVRQFIDDIAKS